MFDRFRCMTCWHCCYLSMWRTRLVKLTIPPSHISHPPYLTLPPSFPLSLSLSLSLSPYHPLSPSSSPQVLCNHLPSVVPQLQSHCATELSACLEEDNPAKLLKPLLKMVLKLVVTLRRKEEVNQDIHVLRPASWITLTTSSYPRMYTRMYTHSCHPSWTPPSSSPPYTPSPPTPHLAPTWKKSMKKFRRPSLVMLPWQPTSEERDQNTRREEPTEHRFWCCNTDHFNIWMNVTQKVMSHIIIKSNFESIWYTETLCARTHTPPKPTTLIIRNAKKPNTRISSCDNDWS